MLVLLDSVGQLFVDDCLSKFNDWLRNCELNSRTEVIIEILDTSLQVYFTTRREDKLTFFVDEKVNTWIRFVKFKQTIFKSFSIIHILFCLNNYFDQTH